MLIGHDEQGRALRTAFNSGRIHHAWLLAGPRGVGKASFAAAAAAWVLARTSSAATATLDDSFDLAPDHPTARLLAAGSHLDFRLVELLENPRTGKMRPGIALDQFVRRDSTIGEPLSSILWSTPALATWRVVVVDAVDDLNRAAANAFLKNLEEPPPNTLFLAVSHAPGRLLPTIRSRCRLLRFHSLGDADLDAVLARRLPDLPPTERQALVAAADGSPGRAVRLAASSVGALSGELAAIASSPPAEATARSLTLGKSVATKSGVARYEALLELVPAYLASAARGRTGVRLAHALSLWEKSNELSSGAVRLSLDPQSVAFELGLLVGGLADAGQDRRTGQ